MNSKIELNQDTLSKYKELERKIEKYEKKRLIRSILFSVFPILLIIFLSLYLYEHQQTIKLYLEFETTLNKLKSASIDIEYLIKSKEYIDTKKQESEKIVASLEYKIDSFTKIGKKVKRLEDSLKSYKSIIKEYEINKHTNDSTYRRRIDEFTESVTFFQTKIAKSDSINDELNKVITEIESKTSLIQNLKIDSIAIKRFDNTKLFIRFNLNGLENIKNSIIEKNNKFTIDIKIFDIDNSEYIVPNEGVANGKGKQFESKSFIISRKQVIKNAEIKYLTQTKNRLILAKTFELNFM